MTSSTTPCPTCHRPLALFAIMIDTGEDRPIDPHCLYCCDWCQAHPFKPNWRDHLWWLGVRPKTDVHPPY